MITRVTTDVDVLNDLFASGLVTIIGDVLMLSFVAMAMFRLSPGLTLLLLAVMPLVVLVTIAFRRAVTNSYRRIRVAIAKINSLHPGARFTAITVVQLFIREERQPRRVREDQPRAHDRFQGLDQRLRAGFIRSSSS